MKIPALYLPRAGFFIALKRLQNFFRQSSGMATCHYMKKPTMS